MPTPPLPQHILDEARDAADRHHGNIHSAAAELGLAPTTLAHRLSRAGWVKPRERVPIKRSEGKAQFEDVPKELEGDELVDYLDQRSSRRLAVVAAKNLRVVNMKERKPIGLIVFGDPHLDDDYCDRKLVRKHLAMTHQDGVWGLCIGDVTNNWGGRLERLYAEQGATRSEAVKLIDWFMQTGHWLAFGVSGNHEKMTAHDPVSFLAHQHGLIYHDWELRLELRFPKWQGADPVRVNLAHNHTGVSQWVRAFGGIKQATLHERDDVYICGHHHVSGQVKQAVNDSVVTAVRVGGYKQYDLHALTYGHKGDKISESVLVLLCPDRPPAGRVTVFEDLELGLNVLRALRA